jgi:hypothetical protein
MATSSEPGLITLKGGLVTSIEVLRLLWALEDRGFHLQPEGDRLRVQPSQALSPEDVAAIREHRDELLALVRYSEAIQ